MSIPLPTYEQVLELPAQIDRVVPPEFIDENGHMNIGRYLELGGNALWLRCQHDLGMPHSYIVERRLTTFTAEHHLTYLAEILVGSQVSVHTRLIARTDKVLHATALILNRSTQSLSCTMETTMIHMDLTRRRPAPFPDDVSALVDAGLAADDLPWPAPVSGSMGVRDRS